MTKQTNPGATNFVSTIHHDTYEYIKTPLKELHHEAHTILVTGASRGIGQAIAVSYARAGCQNIILLARSSLDSTAQQVVEAAKKVGHTAIPRILCINMDVTSLASVRSAAQEVGSKFGAVDVLINNAGYMEAWNVICDSDPDDWWKAWEVNVKGTYLVTREFLPLVLKSRQRSIITISSAGAWFTLSGGSAYEGTKTAQIRMNNHLNFEYREQGVLAYAVHPGGIKTELSSAMPANFQSMLGDTSDLPADTIVWLTRERREWLADRYISVSWDMRELMARKDEIIEKGLLKLTLSQ